MKSSALPVPVTSERLAIRVFLTVTAIVLLSGCSVLEKLGYSPGISSAETPQQRSVAAAIDGERLMIKDLVSALVQTHPPITTAVQIGAFDDSDLTLATADALASAGYALQKVSTDQGANLLSTELMTTDQSGSADTTRLRVNLGNFSISRSYDLLPESAVRPVSPFRVYGSTAPIDIDNTIFGSDSQTTGVATTEYTAARPVEDPQPKLSLITPEVVNRIAETTDGSPEPTSLNSSRVEVSNLFYSDSTFESMFDNREPVDDLTVIFPNDSIVLGNENKLLIRRFTADFQEQRDVISVVGCSNGPTAADIGNVGLALGRAERVTNELVRLGIPREKILDEGCWAPELNVKEFPGRGVVLRQLRGA